MADPALEAALAVDGVTLFCAVRFAFPARTVFLLDGAAQVTFGGETYLGLDPEFGTLDSIDVISGGEGEQAPEISLVLNPADAVAATTLANPAMQGSETRIYVGALDRMTGVPIGAPELKFLGEVDVPTLSSSMGSRTVEYSVVSVFDRLFDVDEGIRASDAWHQSVWPGEKGLEYMTAVEKNLYWGQQSPQVTNSLPPMYRGFGNFNPIDAASASAGWR